jgi:hypothetical protein
VHDALPLFDVFLFPVVMLLDHRQLLLIFPMTVDCSPSLQSPSSDQQYSECTAEVVTFGLLKSDSKYDGDQVHYKQATQSANKLS